jgi:thiamine pyrophosphokinase
MSSHHIVREKQEPALLVLGLDNFPDELFGQLLEWSPTVIATADTAEILSSREIKIDRIIAEPPAAVSQSDVKLISAGEGNLTEAALKFLAENGYLSVNIITDELKLGDYEPFVDLINLVIFSDHQKIYAVTSGFSKWKPEGERIKLLSESKNLVTEGLHHTNGQQYKTSNDGFFSLRFDEPFLFVAEEI